MAKAGNSRTTGHSEMAITEVTKMSRQSVSNLDKSNATYFLGNSDAH